MRFRRVFRCSRKPRNECAEVRELASEFVDGDLPEERAGFIKQHLDKCPPCKRFVNSLLKTMRFLKLLPPATPPEDLVSRVKSRLHREAR